MSDKSELSADGYKVQELLSGSSNYRTWSFSMKILLQAKDLWDVVDGTEPRPTTKKPASDGEEPKEPTAAEKKAQAEWDKKARKALATIALGISSSEQENIIDCTTPKEVWDILATLYEGKGRNRKFMLLQELFQLSMESMTMTEYLRSIKEKLSELSRIGTKLEKDVKMALVLNGLPDTYRYLVVSFESQDMDRVDFDELSARLLEEEKKVDPRAGITAWKAAKAKETNIICYSCGHKGHFRRDCPTKKEKEKPKSEAKFAM
jgi:hypothetical protein